MWIHPKDEVQLNNKKLVVKSVQGLYSAGPVNVILEDESDHSTTTIPLTQFNQLHEDGKLQVNTHGRKQVAYAA
jgi:hypothetical protein